MAKWSEGDAWTDGGPANDDEAWARYAAGYNPYVPRADRPMQTRLYTGTKTSDPPAEVRRVKPMKIEEVPIVKVSPQFQAEPPLKEDEHQIATPIIPPTAQMLLVAIAAVSLVIILI